MTYEEAVDFTEEASELRRRIYDQGLLKATAVVNIHHDEDDDTLKEVVGYEVEHGWLLEKLARACPGAEIFLECRVCDKVDIDLGHTCIDGAITEKQLRRMRHLVPGWKWPRKAKSA
ncbi:MAG: hypothetical protein WC314_20810 [Vulcanimicrobiota bacterium]